MGREPRCHWGPRQDTLLQLPLWEQSYVTPLPINSEFDDAFLIARIYFYFSFVHHE